jgi:hypothetical protein
MGFVLLASCSQSQTPSRAKVGTPEFFWNNALDAYQAGDYRKAAETLSRLPSAENPFTARARLGQILLDAGLARGYAEMAERYTESRKVNRANADALRRPAMDARTTASRHSLRFTEAVHRFMETDKSTTVQLPFPYPSGTLTDPPPLLKLKSGKLLQGAEVETFETAVLQRNVIQVANRFAGTPDDATAAAATFKTGNISRDQFLTGAAVLLFEQSKLFGQDQLDQPQRLRVLYNEAMEALSAVAETAETKAMKSKIGKLLEKSKAS